METISNETCAKCQHCGEWTNFAGSEHYQALRKDAERYRWLRECNAEEEQKVMTPDGCELRIGADLDAAIDAAMRAE